jgi:hypothetical protein
MDKTTLVQRLERCQNRERNLHGLRARERPSGELR